MKKISTVQIFGSEIFKEQKLTIGVDLGDRWSFYCVLEEAGKIILLRYLHRGKHQVHSSAQLLLLLWLSLSRPCAANSS